MSLKCPNCKESLVYIRHNEWYCCNSDSSKCEKGQSFRATSRSRQLKKVPTDFLTPEAFHAKYGPEGAYILITTTGDDKQMLELANDLRYLGACLQADEDLAEIKSEEEPVTAISHPRFCGTRQ